MMCTNRSFASLGLALLLAGASACLDPDGPGPTPPLPGLVVSGPVLGAVGVAASVSAAALAFGSGASESVVYVSLAPGSVPDGLQATIRDQATGQTVTTSVADGGFDPVALPASVGDTVTVEITRSGSTDVLRVVVTARRPPVVVRTEPRRGKTDVPVNSTIIIVFSEPIDATSLTTSSVRLWRGATAVAGTVQPLEGSATSAVFTPAALLDPNTDYRLEVTRAVRNLTGDALEAAVIVDFTTGATVLGALTSVSVIPDGLGVFVGSRFQMTAIARDDRGNTVAGRPVAWASSDPAVVSVSATGLVTGRGSGSATVTATFFTRVSDTATIFARVSGTAAITVTGISTVGEGYNRTCSLTTGGAAYCWGHNGYGYLGTGDTTFYRTTPAPVLGGLTFAAVSVGPNHTCGVTPSGAAYCWGFNWPSQLDEGTFWTGPPLAVPGGLTFTTVEAGNGHTCGVTPSGTAYCWGENMFGQRGEGSWWYTSGPVAVSGGLTFAMVSAGYHHTCGVTPSGTAYCWGYNGNGQLGDGSPIDAGGQFSPVAVSGGLTFTTVDAGGSHTCGVTTSGTAYCWGDNQTTPVAVKGGLTFATVSAGDQHTCGVTTGGAAYCWGYNETGALGDGSLTDRSSPVAVLGGLTFATVSAGAFHTCGVTTSGAAYCWGDNDAGALGDGSTTWRLVPTPVVFPLLQ
jgi:alpha-tubulin suppressor-like RCC1 family protein